MCSGAAALPHDGRREDGPAIADANQTHSDAFESIHCAAILEAWAEERSGLLTS